MAKIRWYDANKRKPKTINNFFDSANVLCIGNTDSDTPVVCWYNSESGEWIVASTKANNDPIDVSKWAYLDGIMPRGIEIEEILDK
jgi:hypothetical protein